MGIREKIRESKARERVEKRTVLGEEIQICRLTVQPVLDLKAADNVSHAMMQAAILDKDGQPVFASVQEIKELDWDVFQAFQKPFLEINGLNVEEAEKK